MKKRITAVLIAAVAIALTCAVMADGARLEVRPPGQKVEAGETFSVTVDLTGNPGFSALQFTMVYDTEKITAVGAEAGPLLEKADMKILNPEAEDGAVLVGISLNGIRGDGRIASFTFQAKKAGDNFGFDLVNVLYADAEKNPIPYTVSIAKPEADSGDKQDTPSNSGSGQQDTPSNSGSGKQDTPSNSGSGQQDTPSNSGSGKQDTPADSGSGRQDTPSNSGSGKQDTPSNSGSGRQDTPADSGSGRQDTPSNSGNGQQDTPSNSGSGKQDTPAAPVFSDTAGNWAESYIRQAAERGLVNGYGDGTYRPGNLLTRAQFVMVLWNLAGRPQPSDLSTPFTDTASLSADFRRAIAWAYHSGYISGSTPTSFFPQGALTRQAALKILFSYSGGTGGVEMMLSSVYDKTYVDSGSISAWARPAMYWGVYHGILNGSSPNTLSPGASLTRAQLAAIMVRYTDRFHSV